MAGKKIEWADLASEICADLVAAVDAEKLAHATGLNPNSIYCFGYKSKPQTLNLVQFGLMLDRVQEENPVVVARVIKKLAAHFGMFAESLENLARDVARNNGG